MEAAMVLDLQLRSPRAGLDERVEESREEALAVAGTNLTGGGVRRRFRVGLLFAFTQSHRLRCHEGNHHEFLDEGAAVTLNITIPAYKIERGERASA